MWVYCLLLTAGIFTGVCEGRRSDFVTFLVDKVKDCNQKREEAAFDMHCYDCFEKREEAAFAMHCYGKDCVQSKVMSTFVPCLKMGYDILYENSTYSLREDQHVRRTAHCAIEGFTKGITNGRKTGYFRGCLKEIKGCIKRTKDEL